MGENFRKYWNEMHQKHPDALLLFRHGDFYEAYNEDAVACATILGITLTTNKDEGSMAGFPYHALDTYLPKLIRAGKRVAICDYPIEPPKRGNNETINETSETKSEETMKQNMTAQDYVGKTIVVGENVATIVIKSADGDTLNGEFKSGNKPAMPMPIKLAQLEKYLTDKVWKIQDATATATDDVEEVEDVQPQPAKTVTMDEKPKAKPKAEKPKAEKPKTEKPKTEKPKGGRYTFKTYTREKNGHTKTLGRIDGFAEGDEWLEREVAEKLHASPMYDRNEDGTKTWWLSFGKRYVDAGRKVCEAMNAGKTVAEMQAIVDAQTDENHRLAEERKAKREADNSSTDKTDKVYSAEQVAAIIENFAAGKELPEDIRKHIKQAA